MNYSLRYDFYPVGQGLFTSGTIRHPNDHQRFSWVYDCGTSSSLQKEGKELLSKAYGRLKENIGRNNDQKNDQSKPTLDLVAISHFDKDHINGFDNLFPQFNVKRILLPYMPLWQRLIVAFEEKIRPLARKKQINPMMHFFINPVSYIKKAIDGVEIVLVPPTPKQTIVSSNEDSEEMNDFVLQIDERVLSEEEKGDLNITVPANTKIKFVKDGGRLYINGIWEFVPYNEAKLDEKATSGFQKEVDDRRNVLYSENPDAIQKALLDLKDIYGQTFGNQKRNKNIISLFLYGGPIHAKHCCPLFQAMYFEKVSLRPNLRITSLCPDRCGILYTGDGYLNTTSRIKALKTYLNSNRIAKLHTLQVMHHGAKGNCHRDVPTEFNPVVSLFSSDPDSKRYRHPNASVLRYFVSHGPVLVDKKCGATIFFFFH